MKRLLALFPLASCLAATAPAAQQWNYELGQGILSAFVEMGEDRLYVNCRAGSNLTSNQIEYYRGPRGMAGPVVISVNGEVPVTVDFDERAGFEAFTPAEQQVFAYIVGALRRGSTVTLTFESGASVSFPLSGSAASLAQCPVSPVAAPPAEFAAAPPAAPAPAATAASGNDFNLQTEESLAQLGYDPGPVDGVADAALFAAISAWQAAQGYPVTGGLNVPQFLELQAMAAAAPATTAPAVPGFSVPSAPASTPQPTSAIAGTDRLPYHRLEGCTGRPGFGAFEYQMPGQAYVIRELSDFCYHPETASMESAEPIGGFTEVTSLPGQKNWEILADGPNSDMRCKLYMESLFLLVCSMGNASEAQEFRTSHIARLHPSRRHPGAEHYESHGVFVAPAGNTLTGDFWYGMFAFGGRPDTISTATAQTEPIGLTLNIAHPLPAAGGRMDLALAEEASWNDVTGGLDISVAPDGLITVSGTAAARSQREAGHAPQDWRTSQMQIDEMIGRVTDQGHAAAYGLVSGTYVDGGGQTQTWSGKADLYLCAMPRG